ncbi:Winged helix-turn-helix DNA-binding domain [Cinara cedri]|uniref:Winged helix-turn-helix DNA-binding domain n=1 Tax=Cinara cedri TaxID=506608 RepID=A0A5E4MPS0_9HEMI|nr:Winged helix-turn-helix DNA-binding domain [Cinara cedri]
MKILIIFLIALFLLAVCQKQLSELRYRNRLTANQIYNILTLSNNMKFFRITNGDFDGSNHNVSKELSLRKKFHKVKEELDKLTHMFLLRSFGYVVKNLHYHLLYIHRKLKDRSDGPLTAQEEEMIRFPNDQELCIFTYVYDYGEFDVEYVLEAMHYLKTFTESDVSLLKVELARLHNNIRTKIILPQTGNWNWNDSVNDEIRLKENSTERWMYIKDQIYWGSKIFCDTAGPPLIGEDLFDTEEIKSDMFLQHVFVAEVCKVVFKNENESMYSKFLVHYVPSVTHRIMTWDCSNILKTKEFSYECHKKEGPDKDFIRVLNLLEKFYNTPVKPELQWRIKRNGPVNDFYSLESLRKSLENNRYFLNVIQYDNIAADVMLYVAIKEGYRIVKWIDLIIRSQCTNISKIDDTIMQLDYSRSILSLFKYHFHAFINTVLKKRRIDLRENTNLKEFNDLTNNVLSLMSFLKGSNIDIDIIHKNCPFIIDEIAKKYISGTGMPSGNLNPFKIFSMKSPVLNIRRLTNYVSNIGTKY